jgi:hypothetical protein
VFDSPELEIWNLTEGGCCVVGAQRVFNVVGALKAPLEAHELSCSLNGRPPAPVFFGRSPADLERLAGIGHFNVDAIPCAHLEPDNEIRFRLRRGGGAVTERSIRFRARLLEPSEPSFRLDLEGATAPEEVGQIVEGRWRVSRDPEGRPCLAIEPQDTGYDRIILFGSERWASGYEVAAELRVTRWTGARDHGLGLAFKWNPHEQGDGTRLPARWSTGLAMYYFPKTFTKKGLRLSIGVDVHLDAGGRSRGERILGQAVLSPWRWLAGTLRSHVLGLPLPVPQIPAGSPHRFRLRVGTASHALAVWRADRPEPPPQIVVADPPDLLPRGSVGIVAHHCAVRVTELHVAPLARGNAAP